MRIWIAFVGAVAFSGFYGGMAYYVATHLSIGGSVVLISFLFAAWGGSVGAAAASVKMQ